MSYRAGTDYTDEFNRTVESALIARLGAGRTAGQLLVGDFLVFMKVLRPDRAVWLMRDMTDGGKIVARGEATEVPRASSAAAAALADALQGRGYPVERARVDLAQFAG